jgi:3,4-dihydroxy-2-butanone 4-phosphate synthase
MSYQRVPGPFDAIDIATLLDDTLPPGHVKILSGEDAHVFRTNPESESSVEVARWPEKAPHVSTSAAPCDNPGSPAGPANSGD